MSDYQTPSDAAEFYLKHEKAMEPIKGLAQDKSFGVILDGFSLNLLRDIANRANSVGNRAVVVIPWETGYEVRRLPDGSDPKLFYKYFSQSSAGGNVDVLADSVIDMKRIVSEYSELNFEDCQRYDTNMPLEAFESGVISYAYLQRRVANLRSYRNAAEGATKRMKATLESLIEAKLLTPVEKGKYEFRGKLYQITLTEA